MLHNAAAIFQINRLRRVDLFRPAVEKARQRRRVPVGRIIERQFDLLVDIAADDRVAVDVKGKTFARLAVMERRQLRLRRIVEQLPSGQVYKGLGLGQVRSEERRVGQEWVSTCSS